MDGDSALDAIISRVRGLRSLAEAVVSEAAPAVQEAAKSTAAAGTTPSGQAWVPKKDGGRALEHAADAVSVVAAGETLTIVLEGPEVYHHHGHGNTPTRQIIPKAGDELPQGIVNALQIAASKVFARATGGA